MSDPVKWGFHRVLPPPGQGFPADELVRQVLTELFSQMANYQQQHGFDFDLSTANVELVDIGPTSDPTSTVLRFTIEGEKR